MGFKDWYNKELANDKRSAVYIAGAKRGFKAGQQSKQAEIEHRTQVNAELAGELIRKQAEIDVLQKRINEALNVFKSDLSEIGKFDTIHKILKGEVE